MWVNWWGRKRGEMFVWVMRLAVLGNYGKGVPLGCTEEWLPWHVWKVAAVSQMAVWLVLQESGPKASGFEVSLCALRVVEDEPQQYPTQHLCRFQLRAYVTVCKSEWWQLCLIWCRAHHISFLNWKNPARLTHHWHTLFNSQDEDMDYRKHKDNFGKVRASAHDHNWGLIGTHMLLLPAWGYLD